MLFELCHCFCEHDPLDMKFALLLQIFPLITALFIIYIFNPFIIYFLFIFNSFSTWTSALCSLSKEPYCYHQSRSAKINKIPLSGISLCNFKIQQGRLKSFLRYKGVFAHARLSFSYDSTFIHDC